MNPYSPPIATVGSDFVVASTSDAPGSVASTTIDLLRQTRPWVRFMSVMSFIGSGFMLIFGVAVMVIGSLGPSGKDLPTPALGLVYVPLAFLYVYPGVKLWSYASAIEKLTLSRAVDDLDGALGQQKSFWRFVGIMALVVMGLYAVGIVVAVVVAATR